MNEKMHNIERPVSHVAVDGAKEKNPKHSERSLNLGTSVLVVVIMVLPLLGFFSSSDIKAETALKQERIGFRSIKSIEKHLDQPYTNL